METIRNQADTVDKHIRVHVLCGERALANLLSMNMYRQEKGTNMHNVHIM